jgi:hypothetical protein
MILYLMSVATPVRAANDIAHPNDPLPRKTDDDPLATIQPIEISPAANKALASNDYTTVAQALFSAESQADIDALTPEFERLRSKSHLASPQKHCNTHPAHQIHYRRSNILPVN